MTTDFQPISVLHGVDRARFEAEILPGGAPVVMKGLVAAWPAVAAGRQSPEAAAAYFKALDRKRPTSVSLLDPAYNGRFFYAPDMKGFNFRFEATTATAMLDWLLRHAGDPKAPSAYVQSLMLPEHMPGFAAANPMPLLAGTVPPRLWIGNTVRTQTHFDPSYNIACLVAGRRRFTLFPPEQIENLYPSPFDTPPGGVPVSMASIEEPDFERFPRLKDALAKGMYADLEPGDALFIPYAWWHHVQSRGDLNLLVNYWWNSGHPAMPIPTSALFMALLTVRDLNPEAKAVWKRIFDIYVFGDRPDMVAHLPESSRSAFGQMTAEVAGRIRSYVKAALGL